MRFSLRPLFFLPRRAFLWAHDQAVSEHLMDTPFRWLFAKADNLGICFAHKGDEVIWTWPWRRAGKAPFISVGFSGTGEWGDARYWTLADLDRDWDGYYEACSTPASPIMGLDFPLFAGSPSFHHAVGQATQPLVNEILAEIERKAVETLMSGFIAQEELRAGDLVSLTEDGKHVRKAT